MSNQKIKLFLTANISQQRATFLFKSLQSPVTNKLGNTIPNLPMQVYSKRKADQKKKKMLVQFSDPIPINKKLLMTQQTLNFPCRKGTKKCTQHPIANIISFEECHLSYNSFLTKVHLDKTPNNVEETLQQEE